MHLVYLKRVGLIFLFLMIISVLATASYRFFFLKVFRLSEKVGIFHNYNKILIENS